MSENPEEIITGTIDDYLLALADGIVKAQDELNRISVNNTPGQPAVQYQIPKLDFELKMSFALEKESETKIGNNAPQPKRGKFGRKIPQLQAMPINPTTTSENFSADAVSTIKGSFIAIPLNGGKPPNVLSLILLEHTKQNATIQITLKNAVGEPLSHQTVGLGVDRDFSQQLNEERGLSGAKKKLKPTTEFKETEVSTDVNGTAIATLGIAPQEASEVSIVVEATIGNLSESLIIHRS